MEKRLIGIVGKRFLEKLNIKKRNIQRECCEAISKRLSSAQCGIHSTYEANYATRKRDPRVLLRKWEKGFTFVSIYFILYEMQRSISKIVNYYFFFNNSIPRLRKNSFIIVENV